MSDAGVRICGQVDDPLVWSVEANTAEGEYGPLTHDRIAVTARDFKEPPMCLACLKSPKRTRDSAAEHVRARIEERNELRDRLGSS